MKLCLGRAGLIMLLFSLFSCAHRDAARDALALAQSVDALWQGSVLITGLGIGRDRPGEAEKIWVAAGREVSSLGAGGNLELEWTAPRFSRILRMEVGDLNADGSDEWLILIDAGTPRSFVVGLDEGRRQPLCRPWNGYLRMVPKEDGGVTLYSQSSVTSRPFYGPVYEMAWDEDGQLKRGAAVSLPRGIALYDYFVAPGAAAEPRVFSLERTGHLAERDPRSPASRIWRSDHAFLARPVEFERDVRGYFGEQDEERIRLSAPVHVLPAGSDGTFELLTVGRPPPPTVVFEELRFYEGGDVRLLASQPRGVVELRRSPLFGRQVVAVAPWTAPSGRRLWVAAVWTRVRTLFSKSESRILALDPVNADLLPAALAWQSAGSGDSALSTADEVSVTSEQLEESQAAVPVDATDPPQPQELQEQQESPVGSTQE